MLNMELWLDVQNSISITSGKIYAEYRKKTFPSLPTRALSVQFLMKS